MLQADQYIAFAFGACSLGHCRLVFDVSCVGTNAGLHSIILSLRVLRSVCGGSLTTAVGRRSTSIQCSRPFLPAS